jgi:hypothetical protein
MTDKDAPPSKKGHAINLDDNHDDEENESTQKGGINKGRLDGRRKIRKI